MGHTDFSIPPVLISPVETTLYIKHVFARALYVLKVSYIWSVYFLSSIANSLQKKNKNLKICSHHM